MFISYGPFPVLYPTWTLELIVVLSLIVAAFQSLSATRGIYFAAAFIVLLVALGKAAPLEPAMAFYTNPILIDFALGVFGYRIITGTGSRTAPCGHGRARFVTIAVTGTFIGLRPFAWPEAPRLLALGLPVSLLVLSALTLERVGVFRSSNLVNFLAKCSYCIYLTHWFVSIVSEKVIVDSRAPAVLAAIMLIVVPVVVTYLAIAVYLYVEVPVTRRLSRLLAPPRPRLTTGSHALLQQRGPLRCARPRQRGRRLRQRRDAHGHRRERVERRRARNLDLDGIPGNTGEASVAVASTVSLPFRCAMVNTGCARAASARRASSRGATNSNSWSSITAVSSRRLTSLSCASVSRSCCATSLVR